MSETLAGIHTVSLAPPSSFHSPVSICPKAENQRKASTSENRRQPKAFKARSYHNSTATLQRLLKMAWVAGAGLAVARIRAHLAARDGAQPRREERPRVLHLEKQRLERA